MSDRVCPYCGVQLGPRAVDMRGAQFAAAFLPRANTTSLVILVINIVVFVLELLVNYRLFGNGPQFLDTRTLILMGAKFGPAIQAGQYWRLVTAGFLHGGFLHIAMNSWVLYDLVGEVEQFYGTSRLIVAYILSTITGFWLSNIWHPGSPSMGASAACFGLIGIMLAMGLRDRSDPLAQAVRSYYGRWVVYAIVFSFLPGIDIAAHLGGLAGGFAVGWLGGLPRQPGSSSEKFWFGLAGVALAVTAYSFFMDLYFFQKMALHLTAFLGL